MDKSKNTEISFWEQVKQHRKERKVFRKSQIGKSGRAVEIFRAILWVSYFRVISDLFVFMNKLIMEGIGKEQRHMFEEISCRIFIGFIILIIFGRLYRLIKLVIVNDLYNFRIQIYQIFRMLLLYFLYQSSFSHPNMSYINSVFGIFTWGIVKYILLPEQEKDFLNSLGFKEFMTEKEIENLHGNLEEIRIPNSDYKIVMIKRYMDGELVGLTNSFRVKHLHLPVIKVEYRDNWTLIIHEEELKDRLLLENSYVKFKMNAKILYKDANNFIRRIKK